MRAQIPPGFVIIHLEAFLGSYPPEQGSDSRKAQKSRHALGSGKTDHVLGIGFFLLRAQGAVQYQASFAARNRYKFG